MASDQAAMWSRYQEITDVQPTLFAAPNDESVLGQFVWPLRHAKGSYVVGNYLGTIALAGTVAEMTAIWLFEMTEVTLTDRQLQADDQKRLFGSPFKRLNQARRIEVLTVLGALSPEVVDAYGRIRDVRNRHLHVAQDVNVGSLARDAREIFCDAVKVVAAAIGQTIEDGKLIITAQMIHYLKRTGRAPLPDMETG